MSTWEPSCVVVDLFGIRNTYFSTSFFVQSMSLNIAMKMDSPFKRFCIKLLILQSIPKKNLCKSWTVEIPGVDLSIFLFAPECSCIFPRHTVWTMYFCFRPLDHLIVRQYRSRPGGECPGQVLWYFNFVLSSWLSIPRPGFPVIPELSHTPLRTSFLAPRKGLSSCCHPWECVFGCWLLPRSGFPAPLAAGLWSNF